METTEQLMGLEDSKRAVNVVVNMNDATELPADILNGIAGKNVRFALKMNEEFCWLIDGKKVKEQKFSDSDMRVKKDGITIPKDLIQGIITDTFWMPFELCNKETYRFHPSLQIKLEQKYADCYAHMFYYNEKKENLEFIGGLQINKAGEAAFELTHAAKYLLVVAETI